MQLRRKAAAGKQGFSYEQNRQADREKGEKMTKRKYIPVHESEASKKIAWELLKSKYPNATFMPDTLWMSETSVGAVAGKNYHELKITDQLDGSYGFVGPEIKEWVHGKMGKRWIICDHCNTLFRAKTEYACSLEFDIQLDKLYCWPCADDFFDKCWGPDEKEFERKQKHEALPDDDDEVWTREEIMGVGKLL